MDYTKIMNDKSGKKARVGIVGATKGYGYTLLAQIPSVKLMELRAICSRHPEECLAVLKEIGYPEDKIVVCENKADIDAAAEDTIIVVKDYRLVMECGITAMVGVYRKYRSQYRRCYHCAEKRNQRIHGF